MCRYYFGSLLDSRREFLTPEIVVLTTIRIGNGDPGFPLSGIRFAQRTNVGCEMQGAWDAGNRFNDCDLGSHLRLDWLNSPEDRISHRSYSRCSPAKDG